MCDANKGRVPRREYCVCHGRSRGHAGNGISHLQNIPLACPFCTGSGTRVVRVSLAKRRSGGDSSALIVGHRTESRIPLLLRDAPIPQWKSAP